MEQIPSRSFWHKYQARWLQTGSLVCVGLDSEISKLPGCVLKSENPIWEFNRQIIDATAEAACCYKPNLAFYLSDGVRGLDALYKTVEHIPKEIPVILDCKVGDIGSTMQGYVSAFFDKLGIDAITTNPLMGSDVLTPLLERENGFAFVLALTSNPSAFEFFKCACMAEEIGGWIKDFPSDRIGAVVGATQTGELKRMRELMPDRIFLIPGIGAQGGDLDAVMQFAIASKEQPNVLINSSRGIIFKDSSPNFAETAKAETIKLKNLILAALR
ncbi:MAG: orotidine-5'-phosphate decarboxylase [Candidatus Cloacimonadaceae bacterium]|nr:orotidine-5'-phosphate decarboxylase [Candidatus Cloacimonadaceae bacterium]